MKKIIPGLLTVFSLELAAIPTLASNYTQNNFNVYANAALENRRRCDSRGTGRMPRRYYRCDSRRKDRMPRRYFRFDI